VARFGRAAGPDRVAAYQVPVRKSVSAR
jgi:hypothetical protein